MANLANYRQMLAQPWGKSSTTSPSPNWLTWKIKKFWILELDLAWSVTFYRRK